LAIGQIHPRKNFELLLRAFQLVLDDLPRAECWILGPEFEDGAYGRFLRKLAHDLGLEAKVRFLGESTAVQQFIQQCSLLAVPSRVEPFGLVAIEAMLAERPVVACRVGGLRDIIADGETGSLVPVDDAPAMARAMLTVLKNPKLAHRMGTSGRRRALECFTLERMTTAFAEFYASFLPRPTV
jgi:glycosyltransferase involved in cell wall biosynthesis